MPQFKIPVVMYHSVGLQQSNWLWSHISMPVSLFESQLQTLKSKKYQTLSLTEFLAAKGRSLVANKIVLTFDDGYLDNWVFIFPLLKKYGFKGTLFINPEFIDPGQTVRPNLADRWAGRCDAADLAYVGFLNWTEIREMENSGVFDVQSHSMTHTWYFSGPKVIDFHHPGDKFPWLAWNQNPSAKYRYLSENQERTVPFGQPVYENGRSLGICRFLPNPKIADHLVDFVKHHGKEKFFARKNWREPLFEIVAQYQAKNPNFGSTESPEACEERLSYELGQSKQILEEKLGKKIDFLCFPGGSFTRQALKKAKEVGYKAFTCNFSKQLDFNLTKNAYPLRIDRIGCAAEFHWRGKKISDSTPAYFNAHLKFYAGQKFYLWILRLIKLVYLLKFNVLHLLNDNRSCAKPATHFEN
jgi:peptidoglycan/xylan/chitin deacetylase (PgdA/CDA1 family)